MTIETCMRLVESMEPEGMDESLTLRFLGEIEGKVKVELLGEDPAATVDFDGSTARDTILCVPHPYDQIYWMYLLAMVGFVRGDAVRYENAAAMFNVAYQNYGKLLKRRGA